MPEIEGLIRGLHHITLVTSNQEANRRFYTEILGLRRVKLTVNQDDIYHRHLFYADEKGTTGSAITFFEWPTLPFGTVGLSSPHHLSYTLPNLDALPKWRSWLFSNNVPISGPFLRDGRISLYLHDPDGVLIEIAVPNSESLTVDYIHDLTSRLREITGVTQDMKLTSFNHASPVTTDGQIMAKFFNKLLGLNNVFTKPNPDQRETSSIFAIGNDETPDFLRYISYSNAQDGLVGRGSIHHIAMAVEEDEDQRRVMNRLNDVGIHNSGIVDRYWFKSLYFRDLEGNLLEIATKHPGYAVDEPLEKLGTSLVLPPSIEPKRSEIEGFLANTDKHNLGTWPPKYSPVPSHPERLTNTVGTGSQL